MNIVILSCSEFPQSSEGEHLIEDAIKEQGHTVTTKPWDEVKPTDNYDLFIIRTLWDYIERWDEFEPWFQRLEKANVRTVNSLESVRWNLNKKYMLELEKQGINIPKTFIWEGEFLPNWDKLEAALGGPPFVFKPLISAGGTETFLVHGDVSYSAAIDRMKKQPFIAQNFLKEIKTAGEISAMVFGGEYSHAVKKLPQGGEFRVQSNHGGTVQAFELDPKLQSWAESVVSKAPGKPIIARVDFVLVNENPTLMELEIFEPELFLHFKPESAKKLVNLILKNNS